MAKYGTYKCKECNYVFTMKLKNNSIIICPSVSHRLGGGFNIEKL